MSISPISNVSAVQAANTAAQTTEKAAESTVTTKAEQENSGVVYEKNSSTKDAGYVKKSNSSIVAQLKADAEARTAQLRSLVEKMMSQQGSAIGKAADDDSMWKFLASGDFTVSADVKAQAQADIADDGYWGVEQTSDRILDFAKALSNNDPDKAEEMLEAFKKGFEDATKSWGKELPDISKKTYDAVLEKFDAWKNGDEKAAEDAAKVSEQV
ncbi:MAG: hypothetical protein J6A92_02975 [Lachnospiraceae bacterium]|nr:hypothetical protein [Lachnospiraceae bacterium]